MEDGIQSSSQRIVVNTALVTEREDNLGIATSSIN